MDNNLGFAISSFVNTFVDIVLGAMGAFFTLLFN